MNLNDPKELGGYGFVRLTLYRRMAHILGLLHFFPVGLKTNLQQVDYVKHKNQIFEKDKKNCANLRE
jgi:hypothetical protein